MKLKPILAALALVGLQTTEAVQAQQKDTLQKIRENGVINLGGRDGSFPFSYKISADANPIGFSADLCVKVVDAVKAKLGVPNLKVHYTVVTPANRICAGAERHGRPRMQHHDEHHGACTAVDFAPTHFVGSVTAATKKSSGITRMAQLDGKTVATVTGSTSIQLLRAYRRTENIHLSEISGKDNADIFLLLSSDRAAAMIVEDVQLAGLIARSERPADYRILDERLRDEPYGFIFRKDDPQFKALIDETLTKVMRSGEIDELYAKWFMRPVPPVGVNLNFPTPSAVQPEPRDLRLAATAAGIWASSALRAPEFALGAARRAHAVWNILPKSQCC